VLYVREVLGSNVSRGTFCPDRGFSWFYSVPEDKCCAMISIRLRKPRSNSFQIYYLSDIPPSDHSTPYSLDTEKASLNNPRKCRSILLRTFSSNILNLSSPFTEANKFHIHIRQKRNCKWTCF
jgi:hypothetical protein